MSRARQHKQRNPRPAGSGSTTTVAAGRTDGGVAKAICWTSNSPWASTGYGQQTAQVVTRLAQAGHQVAVASNYGLDGAGSVWNGIPQYARGFESYSNDIIPAHAQDWFARYPNLDPLLVTLYDVWVYRGPKWGELPIASWVPVDHAPAPPAVLKWCALPNVTPIAMSQHGKRMLQMADIDCHYIPHAIEPVFKPTESFADTDGGRITGRNLMGIDDDKFVVLINAANKGALPNRKAFPEMLLAFAIFAQTHDDAVLYLHTERSPMQAGINLDTLISAVGIESHQVKFTDPYAYRMGLPQEAMAALYTAADVLLMPSMGEGFGIPAIEAQACGTPVILSDFSAQTELLGDGWLVEGQPFWNSSQDSWLITPLVPSIINTLNAAYERGRRQSDQAITFAKQYDADHIFREHWVPLLASL